MSLSPIQFRIEYGRFLYEINQQHTQAKQGLTAKAPCLSPPFNKKDMILLAVNVAEIAIFILSALSVRGILSTYKSALWKLGIAGLVVTSIDILRYFIAFILFSISKSIYLHNVRILNKIKRLMEGGAPEPEVMKPCELSGKTIPPEIMLTIFSYLTVKDLSFAARVSKNWKALSNHPFLWTAKEEVSSVNKMGDQELAAMRFARLHYKEIASAISQIIGRKARLVNQFNQLFSKNNVFKTN